MDSIRVIVENTPNAVRDWQPILTSLQIALSCLVAIAVPAITFWYSRRLKELDLKNSERERKFQLEKSVSVKALEVMGMSYHFTHSINRSLNLYNSVDEAGKKQIYQEVVKAREYWEENLFYLPASLRKLVIPLTNMTFASFGSKVGQGEVQMMAFDKVLEMFRQLESAFAALMSKYNLFDGLGFTQTNKANVSKSSVDSNSQE